MHVILPRRNKVETFGRATSIYWAPLQDAFLRSFSDRSRHSTVLLSVQHHVHISLRVQSRWLHLVHSRHNSLVGWTQPTARARAAIQWETFSHPYALSEASHSRSRPLPLEANTQVGYQWATQYHVKLIYQNLARLISPSPSSRRQRLLTAVLLQISRICWAELAESAIYTLASTG